MERDTFKKLTELQMFKFLLEKRISESDSLNVSYEVVLCKTNKDIKSLQTYLRKELEQWDYICIMMKRMN